MYKKILCVKPRTYKFAKEHIFATLRKFWGKILDAPLSRYFLFFKKKLIQK
jgi:hypothetical protein